MVKKAVKKRDVEGSRRRVTQAPRPPEVKSAGQAAVEALDLNATLVEARGRTFESEQEALTFFFDRLVSQGGGTLVEQRQMLEFLELLLETDPQIKEDLLSGIKVKK